MISLHSCLRYKAALENSKLPWKNLTENDAVLKEELNQIVANLVTYNLNPTAWIDETSVIYKNYSQYLTGLMAAVG